MIKKYTIEGLNKIANDRNCICISNIYEKTSKKIKWKCINCNHIWESLIYNFKKTKMCPKCSKKEGDKKKIKYSIRYINEYIKEKDGVCLSRTYKGGNNKLKFKCNKDNNIWYTSFSNIKNGTWCPKCAKRLSSEKHIKYRFADIKKIIEEKNGMCLSKNINNKKRVKIQCNICKYIWSANIYDIIRGSWCKKCCHNRYKTIFKKYNINDAIKIIEEKNGICLSKKFERIDKKLKIKCKVCNNIWNTSLQSIKGGSWCPICKNRCYSEGVFRKIIEFRTGENFPKSYPKWLKNGKTGPRELDMYNKDLKIAIEYNNHKEKFYQQTKRRFKLQQEYDRIRYQRCKDNGVKLIWVPLMKIEEMDKYIKKLCKNNNIIITNNNKLDYKEVARHSELLEWMKRINIICKKKNGICLSRYYIGSQTKLKFKCNICSRVWKAKPSDIIHGNTWCPDCGRRIGNMKKTDKYKEEHNLK